MSNNSNYNPKIGLLNYYLNEDEVINIPYQKRL